MGLVAPLALWRGVGGLNARTGPKKLSSKEPFKPQVNPWLSLAQGVVYQAIIDWRALDDGRTVERTNYTVLRNFFKSAWCENLLLFTDITPQSIIESLEKHSKEAAT